MRNLIFIAFFSFLANATQAQTFQPRFMDCKTAVQEGKLNTCTDQRLASFVQKHSAFQAINTAEQRGVMIVDITVNKDGSAELKEMKLGKGTVPAGAEEAINTIIADMKWMPAKEMGREIDQPYVFHVQFGQQLIKGK